MKNSSHTSLMLVVWVGLCFVVAFLASRYQPGIWYEGLIKPGWTPPNWVFAPVWSLLYLLMGIAAWLIWKQGGFAAAAWPLGFFLLQLILNGLWSWLFFGRHLIGAAMIDIGLLWVAILITMILFWNRQPAAGIMFLPYLLWVSYASTLNFALWRLNP
jgi:benzodiazapine receptor